MPQTYPNDHTGRKVSFKFFKRYSLWIIYFLFAFTTLAFNWHDRMLTFDGAHAPGKAIVWLTLFAFLVYSVYCTRKENFFKTVKHINKYHWARQIGIDLYIGVAMFLVLAWIHTGSAWILFAWLPFILFFANLATLLYLAIHFDGIMGMMT